MAHLPVMTIAAKKMKPDLKGRNVTVRGERKRFARRNLPDLNPK